MMTETGQYSNVYVGFEKENFDLNNFLKGCRGLEVVEIEKKLKKIQNELQNQIVRVVEADSDRFSSKLSTTVNFELKLEEIISKINEFNAINQVN